MTQTRRMILGAVWVLACGVPAWAGVVYNSVFPQLYPQGIVITCDPDETDSFAELYTNPTGREFDTRVGDAITLAGTDRFVTSFAVRIAAFQPYNTAVKTDVTLTLFTSVLGLPVSELWSGTVGDVTLPLSDAGVEVNFAPGITVPDTLVFAVSFAKVTNTGRRSLGLATNAAVYTGASPPSVVFQDTTSGAWRKEVFGQPFNHAEARVTAVPGVPTIGAFGFAALAGLGGRRRSR